MTAQPLTARAVVERGIAAMGGEERLRAVHAVELRGIGHRNALEQSERPEGPWLQQYEQVHSLRDLDGQRVREEIDGRGYETANLLTSAEWTHRAFVVDGGLAFDVTKTPAPGRARDVQPSEELLAFGPERLLLNALGANDLTRRPDAPLHGALHRVVAFTRGATRVRIFLHPVNGYPAAVELTRTRPYDVFWSPWGEVTTRITFGLWTLEPNGLHYPREWTFETNGQPERSLTINELRFNPNVEASAWAIPDEVRAAARARLRTIDELPLGEPAEIAPGVVLISGRWNVVLVREPDGVTVIEAPIATGYSSRVIEEARKRFGTVKAVITTSDAWPHIGGLREYVRRGIALYALDLNVPIIRRLAPAATPHAVATRTKLGSLELIPFRTVTGERQMAVWLPKERLLYTSDLVSKAQDGSWFTPQTRSELEEFVAREHLAPRAIFGMHYGVTTW